VTIKELYDALAERSRNNWNHDFSLSEWSSFLAGEAGELCNVAKKILLHDLGLPYAGQNGKEVIWGLEVKAIHEAVDALFYALLVLIKLGVTDPEPFLREVFNAKSERIGAKERL
jgi:hypothetical protein